MSRHIRKNDVVVVITGDHKGERGKVLRVDARRQRVVVEGINMIYRHVKPTRRNPQGGRIQKEAALHISNVLPLDSKVGRGTRVHRQVDWESSGHVRAKRRVTVKGTVLGDITRASRAERAS